MKKIIKYSAIILIIIISIILVINSYVKLSTKNQIIDNKDYANVKDIGKWRYNK